MALVTQSAIEIIEANFEAAIDKELEKLSRCKWKTSEVIFNEQCIYEDTKSIMRKVLERAYRS